MAFFPLTRNVSVRTPRSNSMRRGLALCRRPPRLPWARRATTITFPSIRQILTDGSHLSRRRQTTSSTSPRMLQGRLGKISPLEQPQASPPAGACGPGRGSASRRRVGDAGGAVTVLPECVPFSVGAADESKARFCAKGPKIQLCAVRPARPRASSVVQRDPCEDHPLQANELPPEARSNRSGSPGTEKQSRVELADFLLKLFVTGMFAARRHAGPFRRSQTPAQIWYPCVPTSIVPFGSPVSQRCGQWSAADFCHGNLGGWLDFHPMDPFSRRS